MVKMWLNQSGTTYLIVMLSIILLGIFMGVASKQWKTMIQRDKEAELFFRGDEIKDAIEAYYKTAHAGLNVYPKNLEDLIKDPSGLNKRYLRRLYKDPMTNGEWEIVKDPKGGIKGVRSRNEKEPLKKANFPEEYKAFEGKISYKDWAFEYIPQPPLPSQSASQQGQLEGK